MLSSIKVTKLYPKNAAENPDNVLEQAIGNFESVFMIGFDHDGDMDVRASTNLSQEQIIWLIERFRVNLIMGEYDD